MNRFPGALLAISMFGANLLAVAANVDDPALPTTTKVERTRLESGFRNPPEESKLRCFWFWQYGVATKASITQDLEAMKAKGYGGALLGDNGGPEGQVGPVFMSEEWKANFAHAVREADRLGLELSLNIQSGWGDPGNPNIQPENAMKKLVFSETQVSGPASLHEALPQPDSPLYYKDVAVQAFPRIGDARPAERRTLLHWDVKSYNKQSGLAEHRHNRPGHAGDAAVDPARIVDLTGKFADGILAWEVPAGEWTIVRYGMAATGKRNNYAADGYKGGLCYDQLHAGGIRAHWNDVAQPLVDLARANGDSLKYVHTDSWEMGLTNWTHDFQQAFRRRRGYDMAPYLPVLANRMAGSREISNRFLEDFRMTVSDLVVEENYRVLRALAHENGLLLHSESGGPHRAPLEALRTLGVNDVPMSEFWARADTHRISELQRIHVKQGASAAHIYGKRYLAAEGPTSVGPQWQRAPRELKGNLDKVFCIGVNRLFWHTYTSSPDEFGLPGFEYFAGTHMNRHVTWWNQAGAFVDYLNRCQHMLAQGLYTADVLAYYGEASPNFVYLESDIEVPPGYAWDMCNTEVLLERATVRDGRIWLPDGMRYRMLYLKPGLDCMSLAVLEKVAQMVREGMVLLGNPPERAAGLSGYPESDRRVRRLAATLWGGIDGKTTFVNDHGEGRVYAGVSVGEVLKRQSIGPDFSYEAAPGVELRYLHRTAEELDIYYVANQWAYADINDLKYHYRDDPPNRYIQAVCSFRVDGPRQVDRFDPVTGAITPVMVYRRKDGRYEVPVALTPEGSVFFVFHKAPERRHVTRLTRNGRPLAEGNAPLQLRASSVFICPGGLEARRDGEYTLTWSDGSEQRVHPANIPAAETVEGVWEITFMERPALGETMARKTNALQSWTEFPTREVRYFSGTARYTKHFPLPADDRDNRRVYLDLGNVQDLATVRLNGKAVDTCWIAPFRVDITNFLAAGDNTLEVDVTNCWVNRLIGDRMLPEEARKTRSNMAHLFEEPRYRNALRTSGLLGPVTLEFTLVDPLG